VAGEQHRHELVAQLPVGHRPAVLVARLEQQREDVAALGPVRLPAALRDLLVDERVGPLEQATQPAPRTPPPQVTSQQLGQSQQHGRVQDRRQHAMQALDPRRLGDAEDDPRDHLERQRARALAHREPLADPPARRFRLGDLADHRPALVHGRALQRRQQQPALPQMLRSVEHEQGTLAEDRGQWRVRLARVQIRLVAREHLPDRVNVGDVDAGPEDQQRHRHDIAVPAVPAQQRLDRAGHQPRRVHDGGRPRPRRQRRQGAHDPPPPSRVRPLTREACNHTLTVSDDLRS